MRSSSGKFTDTQKTSLVPPVVAAISSLVVPGLGQILAGSFRKGFLLLLSLASIIALWFWRIRLVGRLEETFLDAVSKSFYLQPILVLVSIGMIVAYLWIAYDAYITAKRAQSTSGFVVWALILFTFFFVGWQIGDIRPVTLAREAQDAGPFMMRILWPWIVPSRVRKSCLPALFWFKRLVLNPSRNLRKRSPGNHIFQSPPLVVTFPNKTVQPGPFYPLRGETSHPTLRRKSGGRMIWATSSASDRLVNISRC